MTRRSVRHVAEPGGRIRTQPALVGQGRCIALDPASAAAIAAASEKAGFPNPFADEAVTIGADLSKSPDRVTDPAGTEPQTSAGAAADETNED